jgi:hypothetical protein
LPNGPKAKASSGDLFGQGQSYAPLGGYTRDSEARLQGGYTGAGAYSSSGAYGGSDKSSDGGIPGSEPSAAARESSGFQSSNRTRAHSRGERPL